MFEDYTEREMTTFRNIIFMIIFLPVLGFSFLLFPGLFADPEAE
jgi:hypothetical protein